MLSILSMSSDVALTTILSNKQYYDCNTLFTDEEMEA